MENTTNLNLKKPGAEDYYNIDHFNENMDIIDENITINQKDIKNIVKIGVVGAPNGVINENKIYDFTHCEQLVSSGNNFTGRVSTNSSSQYIQKGYLNPQNNSFEFKFLVNRTGAGFSYICDTGNIIFSISNTELKADLYLNGSETPTSLIITGTFTTDTDYWIKLNFNGTNTYTLGYSTNGTTYTNNTLTSTYKLNPTYKQILFGGWYGASRDSITPHFDGKYDFSETSLIIGGTYILEKNNGNLAETGQNLEILFPYGLNVDKTLKSLIAKRETNSVISNINTSENSFYVLAQYISATDLEVIILKKDLISFQTNEDTLNRSIQAETYYNFNKNTNQWKVKFDGTKYWVNLENTSFIILGECFTDYRGVITHYDFYYKDNCADRLLISRDLKNIAELDKDNNFTGNNNFENGEITAKTQSTSDNSKNVATTEFVENKIESKGYATIEFTESNLVNYGNVSEAILEMPTLTSYTGTTITAYAGTKLLLADGLNANNSYKHKIYTLPNNLTCDAGVWAATCFGFLIWQMNLDGTGESIYFVGGDNVLFQPTVPTPTIWKRYKNTATNKWYWCMDGSTWTEIYAYNLGIASINYSTSIIYMFKPKSVTDLTIDENLYTFTSNDLTNLGYKFKNIPTLDITYHTITKELSICFLVEDNAIANQTPLFKLPDLIKTPTTMQNIGGCGAGRDTETGTSTVSFNGRINTAKQFQMSGFITNTLSLLTYQYSGICSW